MSAHKYAISMTFAALLGKKEPDVVAPYDRNATKVSRSPELVLRQAQFNPRTTFRADQALAEIGTATICKEVTAKGEGILSMKQKTRRKCIENWNDYTRG